MAAQNLAQRLTKLVYKNMEMCFGCANYKCSQKEHSCVTDVDAFGGRYRKDFVDAVRASLEEDSLEGLSNEFLYPIIGQIYEDTFKRYRHN